MTTAYSSLSRPLDAPGKAPDPHLIKIRDLVYGIAGIFHPDHKLNVLEGRCLRRMEALDIPTLHSYFGCLTAKTGPQSEMIHLLNEITTGETCFFRNQPQLDALRNVVFAQILEARSRLSMRHLRIWSAGCSTGEEPYTLSMLMLEETAGRLKGWTFEILATDLNEHSLEHCRKGAYGDYSTRNLTPYLKQKYFTVQADDLLINPEVKARVNFTRVNLLDNARMAFMKSIDLILCCNVLIYFDALSKQRVIQHFYSNLLPHGYLFLGHAETLYGVRNDFDLVHLPSTTAYIKAERRRPVEEVKA